MKLYFITGNKHKIREASLALSEYGIVLTPPPRRVAKIEVQSDSLSIIALTAARHAYLELQAPLVAEDAGLFIDALKGFPGPYSNYAYRTIGNQGILKLMEREDRRTAYFLSAVACICPPYEEVFTGRVDGIIVGEPRGSGGFGFDPIFKPLGSSKTFAEMSVEEKNKYSHRARAFRRLGAWLRAMKGEEQLGDGKLKEPYKTTR